jgi:glycosyltransferase involved in cell wall biosynthesis
MNRSNTSYIKMQNIVFLIGNPFTNESRALKEIQSLLVSFPNIQIQVICVAEEGLPLEQRPYPRVIIKRVPPLPKFLKGFRGAGLISLIWLSFQFYKHLRIIKPHLIHTHDLLPLPVSSIFSMNYGCPFIYDSHELHSDTKGVRGFKRSFILGLEKLFLINANSILSVSEPIAQIYKLRHPALPVRVLLNCPPAWKGTDKKHVLRNKAGLAEQDIICLYQGRLTRGRGLEMALECFEHFKNTRIFLVVMGFGQLQPLVEKACANPNIRFVPGVSHTEVMDNTSDADIGLLLTEPGCLNHAYSLPNKLFEYLQAGLAIVASDLPLISEVIHSHNVGMTFDLSGGSLALKNAIDQTILKIKNHRPKECSFVWENEEDKLLAAYKDAGISLPPNHFR